MSRRRVTQNGIALKKAFVVGIRDQQGFAFFGHVRHIALAGDHGHTWLDRGVGAACGHELENVPLEEPKVDSLALQHGDGLFRRKGGHLVEFQSRIERFLEVVELAHAVN